MATSHVFARNSHERKRDPTNPFIVIGSQISWFPVALHVVVSHRLLHEVRRNVYVSTHTPTHKYSLNAKEEHTPFGIVLRHLHPPWFEHSAPLFLLYSFASRLSVYFL